MNVTTIATTILLKRVNQKIFSLHKIVSFRPSAKQTDATQASHRRGIVTKYLVTVDGAWECSPSCWAIFIILPPKIAILMQFKHISLFLKPYE